MDNIKIIIGIVIAISGAIGGAIAWSDSRYSSKADLHVVSEAFYRHLADAACSQALENYFKAKKLAEKYPNDSEARQQYEIAKELMKVACQKEAQKT